MAAPGDAFTAVLRRSQDLGIGERKHRDADRSARSLQARRFFSSLHPTSNKLVHLENCALRVSHGLYFFNGSFSGALFPMINHSSLWKDTFYLERKSPVKLQLVMFWCVKEGCAPKWANATGRKTAPKMSTLLYHPHEIDCITFKKVAPRINRDALFQERRWWAQSTGCTLSPIRTTDNAWKNLQKTTVSTLQDISIFNS